MARVGVNGHRGVEPAFWRGRRVLITGHTGFKGAWLALWLQLLEAEVVGIARDIPTEPSLYALAEAKVGMTGDVRADVRDLDRVRETLRDAQPEVVFHMAAQALVQQSVADPRETFDVNVMGTVTLLEAIRLEGGVRAVVNVTSDKCYQNREWEWGYRENDPMGGEDPYSSSKGCSELVTAAYRRTFFSRAPNAVHVASARAGNVIGGGDWSAERLLPDIMRSALLARTVGIRNPGSIRPWQHVLNPLRGYLMLAEALWHSPEHAMGWNFGPADEDARTVQWIVEQVASLWPAGLRWSHDPAGYQNEAQYLKIDSSMARARLGWAASIDLVSAIISVVDWYRALADNADMRAVTLGQIEALG